MKKLIIIIILLLQVSLGLAQDFHLSQYWSSPLNLNPALTGVMDQNIRIVANYRNQWFQAATFTSYAASVDANLFRNKLKGNFLGVGLGFYQDLEGDGEFKNTGINVNLAYNQKFGNNKTKHYLGFGLQGAYYQKQINLNNLIYGNLFEINSNTDPLDFANYNQTQLIDISAGLQYFVNINKKHTLSTGVAIAHIAEPNVSFAGNSDDLLYRKFTNHYSFRFLLNNDVLAIIPTLLFQSQGPHKQINFGSYVQFILNKQNGTSLYAGGQYRISAYEQQNFGSDAFILGVRAEVQNFDVGFSYDITTSNLRKASNFMGGPELYASYRIQTSKTKYKDLMNCPKF